MRRLLQLGISDFVFHKSFLDANSELVKLRTELIHLLLLVEQDFPQSLIFLLQVHCQHLQRNDPLSQQADLVSGIIGS